MLPLACADGTIRASNNRTDQCITAEPGPPSSSSGLLPAPPPLDIFGGALADGGSTVVFYNRGSAPLASATLPLKELPGYVAEAVPSVRDVPSYLVYMILYI